MEYWSSCMAAYTETYPQIPYESAELCFHRRILSITWSKCDFIRKLICITRKNHLIFLGNLIKNEGLEILIITGDIKGKYDREL